MFERQVKIIIIKDLFQCVGNGISVLKLWVEAGVDEYFSRSSILKPQSNSRAKASVVWTLSNLHRPQYHIRQKGTNMEKQRTYTRTHARTDTTRRHLIWIISTKQRESFLSWEKQTNKTTAKIQTTID